MATSFQFVRNKPRCGGFYIMTSLIPILLVIISKGFAQESDEYDESGESGEVYELTVRCDNPNDLLLGFVGEEPFFNSLLGPVCQQMDVDIYDEPEMEPNFHNANENGVCVRGSVMTAITFSVQEDILTGFHVFCRNVKSDFIKDGDVVNTNSDKDTKVLQCQENYGLFTMKAILKEEDGMLYYDFISVCQKVQALPSD